MSYTTIHQTTPSPQDTVSTIPVYMDPFLWETMRGDATFAVNRWNGALFRHIHLDLRGKAPDAPEEDAIVIKGVSSSHFAIQGSGYGSSGAVAVTMPYGKKPGAIIYIAVDKIQERMAPLIILHEMGHALGADDVDTEERVLMSRSFSGIGYIDQNAATQVSRSFHWDIDTMTYYMQ